MSTLFSVLIHYHQTSYLIGPVFVSQHGDWLSCQVYHIFLSVHIKLLVQCLKISHDFFLPHPSQHIIENYATIWHCITYAAEKVSFIHYGSMVFHQKYAAFIIFTQSCKENVKTMP